MNKILFIILFSALLFSIENKGILTKTDGGFVMTPSSPIKETTTGFLFTGRIIWGDPAIHAEVGDPYANRLVFVSEGETRAWEYVGRTDSNGTFSIPIKPYTQFKLYAWDGSSKSFAMYEGHFYYNSELNNLYQTPTGGEPFIAEKGDVTVVEVE